MQYYAVHCSALQCVAGSNSYQEKAGSGSVWECVALCCSVLQCVAVCCSVLQRVTHIRRKLGVGVLGSVLQCVAVCCSVLQCVAVHCSALQCVAALPCQPLPMSRVFRENVTSISGRGSSVCVCGGVVASCGTANF